MAHRPKALHNGIVSDDEVSISTPNISKIIGTVLWNGAYGGVVAEVLGVALTLEQAIDEVLTRSLAQENEWAVAAFTQHILGTLGRERKIEILPKVLDRHGVQPTEYATLIRKVRELFQLRDKIAHGSVMGPNANLEGLQILAYRRGVSKPYDLLGDEVNKIVANAKDALAKLLPYAITRSAADNAQQQSTAAKPHRTEP
jgi:hypothetical protein